MVDFTRPLVIKDKRGRLRKGQTIRVICKDRTCPVGFRYVLLVYNQDAMFGPEEFVVKAREDGTISGQGFDGTVCNPGPEATPADDPEEDSINGEGEDLKAAFHHRLGYYPVLEITDRHMTVGCNGYDEVDHVHKFMIDTRLLNKLDDLKLGYVHHHLDQILLTQVREEGSVVELTGSRKYSFGDTPDWWAEASTTDTTGRYVVKVDITSG